MHTNLNYNIIATNIQRQTPICIFTKDSIPDRSALDCDDRDGGNDSDFRMMACKATFDFLKYSAHFSRRSCLRSYVPVYVLPHPECNTDNNALSFFLKFHLTICIRVLL